MSLEANRFTLFGLNPNDVATFLVVLIFTVPVLLRLSRRLVWIVYPIETVLFSLLIGTGSRGGMMALIVGIVVILLFCWQLREWPQGRRIWILTIFCMVLGTVAGLSVFPKGFRLGTMDVSPEASAGRRIEVWSTVPNMLASAPDGWGLGNSAEAYEQWYEPIGKFVELRHLLSSHLTWLVELGWPLRCAYLLFWMGAFIILAPNPKFKFPIWGIATWSAFSIALFYNAAGKWWNWPIPVLWILVALVFSYLQKTAPSSRALALSIAVAGTLVGLPFIIFGLHPSQIQVHAQDSGNIVILGLGDPTVAIISPDKKVVGNFYGQAIRKQIVKDDSDPYSIVIVKEPQAHDSKLLTNCRVYVISGADGELLRKWESLISPKRGDKLVLINCRIEPDDWIRSFSDVTYCRGEFFDDPFYNAWTDLSSKEPKISVKIFPRRETYIADWCSLWGISSSR